MLFRLIFLLTCIPLLHAGESELRITRIAPATDHVWLRHADDSSYTVPAALRWCHRFNYATTIPADTRFGPNETKRFTVPGLNDTDSDLWLYKSTGSFGDANNIITGLDYGSSDNGRTGIARTAGLWTGTNPNAPTSGRVLELEGNLLAQPANGGFWETSLQTIDDSGLTIGLTTLASGLIAPLGLRQPPGETPENGNRLFIFEQTGQVRIHANGNLLPTPFLDASPLMVSIGPSQTERGLLGLAFHPNYQNNGFVYTFTSEPRGGGVADFIQLPIDDGGTPNHHSVIRRWSRNSANPNLANAASTVLLRVEQPQANHNAGDIAFGPDGYLYIAIGDGGRANDTGTGHPPEGNGQSLDTLLGCIARIDVDGTNSANGRYGIPADNPFVGRAGLDEIYAYGLRNPYRMAFDPATGDLYTGDVGQGEVEELNLIVNGGNYGWPIKEGTLPFNTSIPDPGNLIDPIAQYDHDDGISIIGGYVWNESPFPELAGRYIFGEYINRLLVNSDTGIQFIRTGADDNANTPILIKGFGTDNVGNLYLCGGASGAPSGTSGRVLQLGPLLTITDITNDDSTLHLDFTADDSLSTFTVESATDLPAQNWIPRPFTINPASRGYRAQLPLPNVKFEAFRVRGE